MTYFNDRMLCIFINLVAMTTYAIPLMTKIHGYFQKFWDQIIAASVTDVDIPYHFKNAKQLWYDMILQ